jgi:hypothetical protein
LGDADVEAAKGGAGAMEVLERKIEGLAVVGAEEEITDLGAGIALGEEIAEGEVVAQ